MNNEFRLNSRERMNGESRIYNLIILDESGSMQCMYQQALSGANETINTIRDAQKANPELKQYLTFVTFDSCFRRPSVRAIIDNMPIDEVKNLTENDYSPNGGTPLHDAIGLSVEALRTMVHEGDSVLVTIITDGMENSSHFYNAAMIRELVESLQAKGWVFTYIGANQDSVYVSQSMGIHNSMDFSQDAVGSAMMFEKLNSSRRAYYMKAEMRRRGECVDLDRDFFSEQTIENRVTPENITSLEPGQIFVFGSNIQGAHIGGAAKYAMNHFGAVMGQGIGPQGQCYAIPTMEGDLEAIRYHISQFLEYAREHPEQTFLVTRIGCGIAGYRDEQIAPFFAGALSIENVYLPQSFWKVINYRWK